MKDFWLYTALRLGLFLATYAIIAGVYYLVFGAGGLLFWPLLLAVVVSAAASWRLLAEPRQRLARRVEERAARASAKVEQMRAREDEG